MAISSMPKTYSDIGCSSMPSRSNPVDPKIEEVLTKIKTSQPFVKARAADLSISMTSLVEMYSCVEDLLHIPLTQQIFSCHLHEKWVEDVLDGSVRLLDVCSRLKDVLQQMKDQAEDLETCLRRRCSELIKEEKIRAYISFRSKMHKNIKKCVQELKCMKIKSMPSSLLNQDEHNLCMVTTVLREVNDITISVLQSIVSFMSFSVPKPKSTRWSLIRHKTQIACEGQHEKGTNEVACADAALRGLSQQISYKGDSIEIRQTAQKELKTLRSSIESLETGLQCLFKCLIQTRVAVLNCCAN